MQIGGVQKTSLLDFPDRISAIIFTKGCNFKCGYCHNPELFTSETDYSVSELFEFLKKRIGKLDGVVITGGEPCLQPDLIEFIKQIKDLGFAVKLDTNGSFPSVIETLLNQNLLDYIAMDIKAPFDKYKDITNSNISPETISRSINLIMNSGIDYEFRTTVVKSQLTYDDFEKIGDMIKGAKQYYLQKFIPSKTLNPEFMNAVSYNNNEFNTIKELLTCKICNIGVR